MVIIELINSLTTRGGAETFFYHFCAELKQRPNIELYVVSLFDDIEESWLKQFGELDTTILTCHKKRGLDLSASRVLKRIIRQVHPDVIHSHLSTLLTYFVAFGFHKTKWKYVHTLHSLANKDLSGAQRVLARWLSRFGRISFVSISALVGQSLHDMLPFAKQTVICNGIPIRGAGTGVDKKYSFIFPARYDYPKNHVLVFKAFDLLCQKQASTDLTLLCLGSGSKLEEYRQFASGLSSSARIMLLDQVTDVYPYLQQSKVFILASYYEGNPISILEAMDCGLPVVASKVGGIPDVVEDGVNGYLVDSEEPSAFADAMEKGLLSATNSEIPMNNRNRVASFSIAKTVDEYLRFFKAS